MACGTAHAASVACDRHSSPQPCANCGPYSKAHYAPPHAVSSHQDASCSLCTDRCTYRGPNRTSHGQSECRAYSLSYCARHKTPHSPFATTLIATDKRCSVVATTYKNTLADDNTKTVAGADTHTRSNSVAHNDSVAHNAPNAIKSTYKFCFYLYKRSS